MSLCWTLQAAGQGRPAERTGQAGKDAQMEAKNPLRQCGREQEEAGGI
jgi:hypothetical protein